MMVHLSKRESQVLQLISLDYSDKDIALELFISYNTVKTHKKNLYSKFEVTRGAGLVRKAFEMGLMQLGSAV